jgi:hypothetical protein
VAAVDCGSLPSASRERSPEQVPGSTTQGFVADGMGWAFGSEARGGRCGLPSVPQRLKPHGICGAYNTTEVVFLTGQDCIQQQVVLAQQVLLLHAFEQNWIVGLAN